MKRKASKREAAPNGATSKGNSQRRRRTMRSVKFTVPRDLLKDLIAVHYNTIGVFRDDEELDIALENDMPVTVTITRWDQQTTLPPWQEENTFDKILKGEEAENIVDNG
jgi:hypothetical protein